MQQYTHPREFVVGKENRQMMDWCVFYRRKKERNGCLFSFGSNWFALNILNCSFSYFFFVFSPLRPACSKLCVRGRGARQWFSNHEFQNKIVGFLFFRFVVVAKREVDDEEESRGVWSAKEREMQEHNKGVRNLMNRRASIKVKPSRLHRARDV